jgi:hypothetical protein
MLKKQNSIDYQLPEKHIVHGSRGRFEVELLRAAQPRFTRPRSAVKVQSDVSKSEQPENAILPALDVVENAFPANKREQAGVNDVDLRAPLCVIMGRHAALTLCTAGGARPDWRGW